MTLPLVLLAIGAAVAGILSLSADGTIGSFLEPVVGPVQEHEGGISEVALAAVSTGVALLGILLGYLVWGSGRVDWQRWRKRLWPVHRTLATGWWFDSVYGWTLVRPGKALAGFSAYVVDRRLVDGLGSGLGRLVGLGSEFGRRLQTGLVRTYALAFLLGVVGLLAYLAVRA